MTQLEWESWVSEDKRRNALMDNFLWNHEHHRYLMKRIYSVKDKLNEDEQQAIDELLEACKWGDDKVQQAKEIVETAEWFSRLQD
jgi:hypothetical protein